MSVIADLSNLQVPGQFHKQEVSGELCREATLKEVSGMSMGMVNLTYQFYHGRLDVLSLGMYLL